MSIFSLFGSGKIKNALRRGAIIIDVRPPNKFDEGHVEDAVNIPVDRLAINAERLKNMNRPIIFCCDSGYESSVGVKTMRERGVKEVYNGGSWANLAKIVKKV
jgi:rhodanese-related sulfurtransferase